MLRSIFVILLAGLAGACQPLAAPMASAGRACPSQDGETAEIRKTIEAFYAALARDDWAAYSAVTTENFRAYEVGRRFTGKALFEVIEKAHRDGSVYVWNVESLSATIDCRVAAAVWETRGSSGVPPKVETRGWLESATLVREDGRWVIAFLHSTPKAVIMPAR